jgi:predicted GNAT family N-acyltransferase
MFGRGHRFARSDLGSVMTPEIVEITASDTHPLRLAVLRQNTPTHEVDWPDDDLPGTTHLGVRLDGELVAISTWVEKRHPDHPGQRAVQVRGMATAEDQRGSGFGGQLLEHGVQRCFAAGDDLVWARARDTALTFYERHGFAVHGPGYIDLTTQLPHHDVIRRA